MSDRVPVNSERFLQTLITMHDDHGFPCPKEGAKYDVYRLKQSVRARNGYRAAESVAFTVDGRKYLTVGIRTEEDSGKALLWVDKFDASGRKPNLTMCGSVEETAFSLIEKATETFEKFGQYRQYRNNCQDFCNMYMAHLGTGDHRTTDFMMFIKGVLVGGAALIAAGVGLTVLLVLGNPKRRR